MHGVVSMAALGAASRFMAKSTQVGCPMDSMCGTNGTGAGGTAGTGVTDPVDSDEWAAPIVLVVMSDCSVQIYSSYSLSSQAAMADSYPPQGWKNFLLH